MQWKIGLTFGPLEEVWRPFLPSKSASGFGWAMLTYVLWFYCFIDFWNVHMFMASQHNTARRDIATAFLFVCLTVRPSVTRSYCVKTTETDRSAVSASGHGCKTFFNVFVITIIFISPM